MAQTKIKTKENEQTDARHKIRKKDEDKRQRTKRNKTQDTEKKDKRQWRDTW